MPTAFNRRTPRAVFAMLALLMTFAAANFVDFLATDYAVAQKELAKATPAPLHAALRLPSR